MFESSHGLMRCKECGSTKTQTFRDSAKQRCKIIIHNMGCPYIKRILRDAVPWEKAADMDGERLLN